MKAKFRKAAYDSAQAWDLDGDASAEGLEDRVTYQQVSIPIIKKWHISPLSDMCQYDDKVFPLCGLCGFAEAIATCPMIDFGCLGRGFLENS
eukprot:scaffold228414_cov28-Prasinocladus_malaysianus.AAC.1